MQIVIEKNINIYRTWSVAKQWFSAKGSFNLFHIFQQISRFQPGFSLADSVKEIWLIGITDRLCFVNRGNALNLHYLSQTLESRRHIATAIPQICAQGQVNCMRGYRSMPVGGEER